VRENYERGFGGDSRPEFGRQESGIGIQACVGRSVYPLLGEVEEERPAQNAGRTSPWIGRPEQSFGNEAFALPTETSSKLLESKLVAR